MPKTCQLCNSNGRVNYRLIYEFTFVGETPATKTLEICDRCAYHKTTYKFNKAKVINTLTNEQLYLASNGMVYETLTSDALLFEFKNRLKVEYPYKHTDAWIKAINDDSYVLIAVVDDNCYTSETCDTQDECFDSLTVNLITNLIRPQPNYNQIIKGFEQVLKAYYPTATITMPTQMDMVVEIPNKFYTAWEAETDDWRLKELSSLIARIIKDQADFESATFNGEYNVSK